MRPGKRKFMLKEDPGNLLAPVFGAYRQRLSDGKYAPKVGSVPGGGVGGRARSLWRSAARGRG